MRTNGLLYIMDIPAPEGAETGFDEDGNPIVASATWKTPLPCSISTIFDSRKGVYMDGNYRQASFNVLIEASELPCRTADLVKLVRFGEDLGEYRVLSIELLASVGRIRIIV